MKKVAIMQPYFFPYIGYFQLVNAVDTFVFYNDVNFIKRGWINRNNIWIQGRVKLITVPCKQASQNKLINEVEVALDERSRQKMLETIKITYRNAPFFEEVFSLFEKVMVTDHTYISELAISSIIETAYYIGLNTEFKTSSESFVATQGSDRADRLIEITKAEHSEVYVNAINGKNLYQKSYFSDNDVELLFLNPQLPVYLHFSGNAEPGLSILDVMMFNSPKQIREFLSNYTLE